MTRHDLGLLAYLYASATILGAALGWGVALRTGGDTDWSIMPYALMIGTVLWLLGWALRR